MGEEAEAARSLGAARAEAAEAPDLLADQAGAVKELNQEAVALKSWPPAEASHGEARTWTGEMGCRLEKKRAVPSADQNPDI